MSTEKNYDLHEMIEWAQGHILKELMKGKYESAVHLVCVSMVNWADERLKKGKISAGG